MIFNIYESKFQFFFSYPQIITCFIKLSCMAYGLWHWDEGRTIARWNLTIHLKLKIMIQRSPVYCLYYILLSVKPNIEKVNKNL